MVGYLVQSRYVKILIGSFEASLSTGATFVGLGVDSWEVVHETDHDLTLFRGAVRDGNGVV